MKKPKTEEKTMTARKFAEAMEVEYATVVRWLKQGLVPGAELKEVMPGVKWWEIPESAVEDMERPKAGRRKSTAKGAGK
jgi:predicted site-specific integrase-resolvase